MEPANPSNAETAAAPPASAAPPAMAKRHAGPVLRFIRRLLEVLAICALVWCARTANHEDIFVAGHIYFVDPDRYARMTRAAEVFRSPGRIVRHHDFENFPQGVSPHTTAPMDYLIAGLAGILSPFSPYPLDLAGAYISPVLAVVGAIVLWAWGFKMRLRYRLLACIFFAVSPILVHAQKLGRPDHQSLLILALLVALCAEWRLRRFPGRGWSITSGIAWGVALWTSLFEPMILFGVMVMAALVQDYRALFRKTRRVGWLCFVLVLGLAIAIEQRLPLLPPLQDPLFWRWARGVGELGPIALQNPIWLAWVGLVPILLVAIVVPALRRRIRWSWPVFVVTIMSGFLTLWQARWAYFFALGLALLLTGIMEMAKKRYIAWVVFVALMVPVAFWWDQALWPSQSAAQKRAQQRLDAVQWRDLATALRTPERQPFMAPWWLSPAITYWSGQPGVAGSSHEAMPGIVATARFYLTTDTLAARHIAENRRAAAVFVGEADPIIENSALILDRTAPPTPLVRTLARSPSFAPRFLELSAQNGAGHLFRINNAR